MLVKTKMNIFLYAIIFICGTMFGSFYTLAVYRIPLGKDITHTRSYCPNCNHKLSFLDMIPIFSYIFLGGKCRYCHKKIRIRYLLLEVLSGVVFTLFAVSIDFNIYNMEISKIIYCICGLLYIAGLFIIAGIDKEKMQIRNGVLLYTIIVEAVYIIYLYVLEKQDIYRYVIYLFVVVILTLINNFYFSKKAKNNYTLQIIILAFLMLTFTYEACTILTITCTILAIAIQLIFTSIAKVKQKKIRVNDTEEYKVPIGFYLCVSNIIMLIITNMQIFYRG
mgnify:CR=1 FL=1